MPDHIYRLTEVVGTSSESVDKAVRAAVNRASRTLKGLDWFEVADVRGSIKDGDVSQYQVTVKIGFRLMEADELNTPDQDQGGFQDPD
jgi:flavin-binding protein dodecin